MAKVRKLHTKHDWEQRIWEVLVNYANAGDETEDFQTLVAAGLDWIGGDISDLENCADIRAGASLESLASRHRSGIRLVLTWLSAPERNRKLAGQGAAFLGQYGTAIRMHVDGNEFSTRKDEPLVSEWPDQIGSVISPVCRFILDQIERHDIRDEKLKDVIPIGLCDRPGCGRFRVIKKFRKAKYFFCSNLCKATFHQAQKTKAEKAKYMREYRAKPVVKKRGKK